MRVAARWHSKGSRRSGRSRRSGAAIECPHRSGARPGRAGQGRAGHCGGLPLAPQVRRLRDNVAVPVQRPSLPRLDHDPDARGVRFGWLLFAGVALLLAVAAWRGVPPERTPFLAVVLGVAMVWPAWRLALWLRHALREDVLAAWRGSYYEFDGRQLRILFDDDGQVWLAADDILDIFGLTGTARDREHLRLMAGRDGVRAAPGTRLQCFTERGLRAWLERRSGRRVGQFVHWLDTQVLVPHRRKLELTGRVPAPRLPDDE